MQWRTVLLLVGSLTAGCSSGAAPGSGSVTNQIDKALISQIDASLQQASRTQQAIHAATGSYAEDVEGLRAAGLSITGSVTLQVALSDASGFCIEAAHTRSAGVRHITETGTPADGPCD